MSHFEFVCCGYELPAVPETCGRFDGKQVNGGSNGAHHPSGNTVDLLKIHQFRS
jgi:hypothetical protein